MNALIPTPVRISWLSIEFSTAGCRATFSCSFLPSSKQFPSRYQCMNTSCTFDSLLRKNIFSSGGIDRLLCSSPGKPFISASFIGNGCD